MHSQHIAEMMAKHQAQSRLGVATPDPSCFLPSSIDHDHMPNITTKGRNEGCSGGDDDDDDDNGSKS